MLSREQSQPRGDDRERITKARQAAEALFISKPPVSRPSVPDSPPADHAARKPLVLRIISPTPVRHDQPESSVAPAPPAREIIPRSQIARIRTWVKYGMTLPQVAKVYGIPVGEIERILHKA